MANLSISSGGKAIETKGLQVRELKDNITLEQAIDKTAANGMDEAFVEADGKRYVIFSGDNFELDTKASISIDGKAAKVIKLSNEINSFGEGISYVPKKGYAVAKAALEPVKYVAPNATTGVAILAGIGAGVLTRNAFSATPAAAGLFNEYGELAGAGMAVATGVGLTAATAGAKLGSSIGKNMGGDQSKIIGGVIGAGGLGVVMGTATNILAAQPSKTGGIGIAAGAVMGIASATAAADQISQSSGAKTARAWATGVGSVALGAATPEIVKLVSKIHIPELAVKGAKIAGVAALVGGTMATVGLAAAGALKSAKAESIDEIAK